MTDKQIILIENALHLFAEKGFSETSVQDITDASGISKGAFYLSFKSKDQLLVSIFEYSSQKILAKLEQLYTNEPSSEKWLHQFFKIQFEEIEQYSNFIISQMWEQTKALNEELVHILNKMRTKIYGHHDKILRAMYGEDIHPHIPDLYILLNGFITGYMEIIIFNKEKLNYNQLAQHLVSVTTSIVDGLSTPLLKKEQLVGFAIDFSTKHHTKEQLLALITKLKTTVDDDNILISLEVIEQELQSEQPRKPVLNGMLSNFSNAEELASFIKLLQRYMNDLS